MSVNEIQYSLTVNTEMTYSEIRKLELILMRVMNYVERYCGNADLNKFINTVQAAIVAARTLQITIHALEAASGPIGWAYAGVSLLASGIAVSGAIDNIYDYNRGFS